jgi:hypothetical protein
MIIIKSFLCWSALNLGYSSGTIKLYRYVLQDYLKECGYDLSHLARLELQKTVLKLKREHAKKNQNVGKPPMLYQDLKNILTCIPNNYTKRNLLNSIFLCLYYTGQRASSCVSVKFNEIYITQNEDGIECANITFNVVKGKGTNANIKKNILANTRDKQMCFIAAFKNYLQTEYKLDIESFKKLKNTADYCFKKLWNISSLGLTDYVYFACEKAGYPKQYFSSHSFRSGVVCDMIMKAIAGEIDSKLFWSAFEQAKILGGWTPDSCAFTKYLKKSMLATLIASRFVNPKTEEKVIEYTLTNPLIFHNQASIVSKWKREGHYMYLDLVEKAFCRYFENISIDCPISDTCKAVMKIDFSCDKMLKNFVQQFSILNFPNDYKQWCEMKTNEDPNNSLINYCYIRAKIPIMKLLEDSGVPFVFSLFIKIIDDYENYKLFQIDEYLFLMENLKNGCFDLVNIMDKTIHDKIMAYKDLKKKYKDAENSQIVSILKEQIISFNANDENNDHESRRGINFTKKEDEFIKKCYEEKKEPTKNWIKKKGLQGRTLNSVNNRLYLLLRKNWKIEYTDSAAKKSSDKITRTNLDWTPEEVEKLKKEISYGKKIKDIDIDGRSYASIKNKSRYFLLDNIKPTLINSEKVNTLKTTIEKISFMRTRSPVELFYICLYPSSKDENCFCRLEKKVYFFIGCGKILSAKLFCDANNILIYLTDTDIRHIKREDIDQVIFCEFDHSFSYKKVIGISQKKDIKNLNVHVMTYGNDDDMKSILQFYSDFIKKPNFTDSKLNLEFITKKMIDIDNMNSQLCSKNHTNG